MSGKTYISQEIVTSLSKRGHAIVTEDYFDPEYDTIDTVYIETQFGAIIRIAVSQVK